MKNNFIIPTIMLASAALAACSSQPEKNAVLEEARSGYVAAQSNPDVTNLAAIELQQAGKALDRANEAHNKREDNEVVDHLAYLAKQQVAIAQETARQKTAEAAVANASSERNKIRLEARTAEADAAKQEAVVAQESAKMTGEELAAANAKIEQEKLRLQSQTAETDAAKQQAMSAQESANQKAAELAAANSKVNQMEAELKDLNAKKTERGMVITLGDVLFDTNKAELSSGGVNSVQKLANFFKEYPERNALIEGFTDSKGSDAYNQDLSERRANAVRTTLMRMGVTGDRINIRGYGEANPIATNETAVGRQLNRRVEIVLSDDTSGVANAN